MAQCSAVYQVCSFQSPLIAVMKTISAFICDDRLRYCCTHLDLHSSPRRYPHVLTLSGGLMERLCAGAINTLFFTMCRDLPIALQAREQRVMP